MKNMRLISGMAVSAIIAAALIINGCVKEKEIDDAKTESVNYNETQVFLTKVSKFNKKLKYLRQNPNLKSGEYIEIDSLVWYLESLFNLTYSYVNDDYELTNSDVTEVSFNVNAGNEVNIDDVPAKYDGIINLVRDLYYSHNYENRGFLFLNIELMNVENEIATLKLSSVSGEKGNPEPEPPDYGAPFGPEDFWYYGEEMGTCDIYFHPDSIGKDAALKIQIAVNNYINSIMYIPCPGGYYEYSDYHTNEIDFIDILEYPNPNDPEPGDNYMDYLIFLCASNVTLPDSNFCLNNHEMNFHYNGTLEVAEDINQNFYPSQWFRYCQVNDYNQNDIQIWHKNDFTYATSHLICPEIPVPIEKEEL